MIIPIPAVLSKDQVTQFRRHLDQANWQDGSLTAGAQALSQKQNRQLNVDSILAQQLGDKVLSALARHSMFVSAALPLKILPPMFNRYDSGDHYGFHVDNAIRIVPGSSIRLRSDLSATLFLSEPNEYQGGELEIEDSYGRHQVKLAAGDLILYSSTSLHRVRAVEQGQRTSAFFWLQSMIRDHEQREILFDLDQSIQSLTQLHDNQHSDVVRLSSSYHKLIRQLADT
ncbi:Fe2+-dependent dioxygenase [Psychromonas sp. MB-3u-54]|uniref:Fe2+-dependent dioxygenase n=1 Tax=Psychromonas sp. MB-3u-54 TaxID=2058319 RepID=UPI000C34681F|nr:Fe2+-dependent dioxygenase [Psychromonas sp. MB-3u-54]PKH04274.1 Fe2+-dependent dioxygenase [Psychromonas sp. MB-3u-54]